MGNEMVTSPAVNEDANERLMESGDPSRNTNSDQHHSLSAWKDRFGWGGGGGLAEDPEEESRPTFRDVYMLQSRIGVTMTCVGLGRRASTAMIPCCVFFCACLTQRLRYCWLTTSDLRHVPFPTISILQLVPTALELYT